MIQQNPRARSHSHDLNVPAAEDLGPPNVRIGPAEYSGELKYLDRACHCNRIEAVDRNVSACRNREFQVRFIAYANRCSCRGELSENNYQSPAQQFP
jgi:hypothetical protein